MDWLDLARYADTLRLPGRRRPRHVAVSRLGHPARSTRTCRSTSSSPGSSPATCCRTPTREQRLATAFNRLHRQTNEGGSIEEEFRVEYVVDRVNTFGTAFLGLTLECARCHDHKFDPITQKDYYSLFAFFNNIDESGLYSHFTNATPSPSLLLWPPAKETQHRAGEDANRRRRSQARRQSPRDRADGVRALAEDGGAVDGRRAAIAADLRRFDVWDGDATATPLTASRATAAADVQDSRDGRADGVDGRRRGSTARSGSAATTRSSIPACARSSRTDPFSLSLRLQAHRDAGSRRRRAPVARVVGRGQPRLRAHARSAGAVLRPHSFLAGQRDRGAREGGRCRSNAVVAPGRDLRRVEPRGRHPPLSRRHAARDRGRPRRLYKDIGYGAATGDRSPEDHPLTIGARFRDSGFKDGLIDDLQVFDTCLTAAEVVSAVRRDAR